MARYTLGLSSLGLVALVACGGKVIVDLPAQGGAGGGTVITGPTGGSGGTLDACSQLQAQLEAAVGAAVTCDPTINAVQCDGSAIVEDLCGCPIVANEWNLGLAAEAQKAYSDWVAEGCGPWECAACPPGPELGSSCDPATAKCAPIWGG